MNNWQNDNKQKSMNTVKTVFECVCKKKLPEAVKFCPYCGEKFTGLKETSKPIKNAELNQPKDIPAKPQPQKPTVVVSSPPQTKAVPSSNEHSKASPKEALEHKPFTIKTTPVDANTAYSSNPNKPLNSTYEKLANYLIGGFGVFLLFFVVFKESPKESNKEPETTTQPVSQEQTIAKPDFNNELKLINNYIADGDLLSAAERSRYVRDQLPPRKVITQLNKLDKLIEQEQAKQTNNALNEEAFKNAKFAMDNHKYEEAKKFIARIKKSSPSSEMLKKIDELMSQDPDVADDSANPGVFNQPRPPSVPTALTNEWLAKAEQNIKDSNWTAARDLLDVLKKSSVDQEVLNKVNQLESLYDSEFKKALSQAPDAIN